MWCSGKGLLSKSTGKSSSLQPGRWLACTPHCGGRTASDSHARDSGLTISLSTAAVDCQGLTRPLRLEPRSCDISGDRRSVMLPLTPRPHQDDSSMICEPVLLVHNRSVSPFSELLLTAPAGTIKRNINFRIIRLISSNL